MAEAKLNKNDILDMLADRALANAREASEEIERQVRKAAAVSMEERMELVKLGVPDMKDHMISRYSGGGDVKICLTVPAGRLPRWYSDRQAEVVRLEQRQAQLRRLMDSLRDNRTRRQAIITEALQATQEGRDLLESIKKVKIKIDSIDVNQQGA